MQQYNLNKVIGVVEVPQDAYGFKIIMADIFSFYLPNLENRCQTLGSSDWQFLSLSKDMTEEKLEQADIIAPEIYPPDGTVLGYLDHSCKTGFKVVDTRLESFNSWLKSEGYVVENALGEKPKFQYEFGEDGPTDAQLESAQDDFDYHSIQWHNAQKLVQNLLIIVKEK